ncbi:hypothetical protein N8134_02150 [Flavobacteriales bacterium]|nr:hypothetical protein [Flavobacteriales bacterium]
MKKVDFFVVGAMKAATTALAMTLNEVDEVSTGRKKEFNFFTEKKNPPRLSDITKTLTLNVESGVKWLHNMENGRDSIESLKGSITTTQKPRFFLFAEIPLLEHYQN